MPSRLTTVWNGMESGLSVVFYSSAASLSRCFSPKRLRAEGENNTRKKASRKENSIISDGLQWVHTDMGVTMKTKRQGLLSAKQPFFFFLVVVVVGLRVSSGLHSCSFASCSSVWTSSCAIFQLGWVWAFFLFPFVIQADILSSANSFL